MGHGNQPRPEGHSRWVPGAGRANEQGFILRMLGSHGGILSEGGVITFAFWKDPSESSVEREGRPGGYRRGIQVRREVGLD